MECKERRLKGRLAFPHIGVSKKSKKRTSAGGEAMNMNDRALFPSCCYVKRYFPTVPAFLFSTVLADSRFQRVFR
jgi:hypothetical protein